MQRLLFLLLLVSVFSSCGTKPTGTADQPSTDSHVSRNALDWNGVYSGTLPCADCEGIQTVLTLEKDGSYSKETSYVGKSGEVFQQKGKFKWNDPGNRITLEDSSQTVTYLVEENRLTQLDKSGNKITGDLAERYILRKENNGIVEKYWKLVELNGQAVSPTDSGRREAHMVLKVADQRVIGNSGCNSFGGTYELKEGNRIRFSQVVSTQMACPDMQTEASLFKVLETADNYSLNNDTLFLNKAKMAPLARFHAVYLR